MMAHRLAIGLLVSSLTGGWLTTVDRARACSCATNEETLLLPSDGGVLASDGMIWSLGGEPRIALLALDGVPLVAETIAVLAHGELRRWPLPASLVPGSVHELTVGACDGFDACQRIAFTAQAEADSPPAVPKITGLHWKEEGGGLFGAESSCGPTAFFRVHVESAPGTIVLLDVGADGGEAPGAAELAALPLPEASGPRALFFVGRVACGPDVWDFDAHDRVALRVAALHTSGRFSGWSERAVAEAPGCLAAPGGSASLLGLLLLRALSRRARTPRAA